MNVSSPDRRVKTALDETRLLILGAQILFGFHLNGAFQNGFPHLSLHARVLHALSFCLMALAISLLIAPSLQHEIVDRGQATMRIVKASAWFAGAALLPIALSLGIDLYIVIGHRFGVLPGALIGGGFGATAIAAWYGVAWLIRRPASHDDTARDDPDTPVDVRVEHMLTEARVLLPGAQALLGFQLVVMLANSFDELPVPSKVIHLAALCCTSLAVILLMAPAAFHRIAFNGRNTEDFYRLGSGLVLAAAVPLGGGLIGDLYVAVAKAIDSPAIGAAVAAAAFGALAVLWLIYPLMLRSQRRE